MVLFSAFLTRGRGFINLHAHVLFIVLYHRLRPHVFKQENPDFILSNTSVLSRRSLACHVTHSSPRDVTKVAKVTTKLLDAGDQTTQNKLF